MNKLSENFHLIEFTRSQTAIRKGIDNKPGSTEIYNLRQLALFVLQPLRDALGVALHISSGYRCPLLNVAIRGSLKSQHMQGKAADVDHPTKNIEIFNWLKENVAFDQLINEYNFSWVHVSFSKRNRNQILDVT